MVTEIAQKGEPLHPWMELVSDIPRWQRKGEMWKDT